MINKYVFGELDQTIKTLEEMYKKGGLNDTWGAELHYVIDDLKELRDKLES